MISIPFEKSALNICRDAFKPVSTEEIFQWARKHIILPKIVSDSGPFDVTKSRWLIEPFKALKDKKVRTVVVAAAIRTGKTLLIDVAVPWFIAHRPGNIQFSSKTDQMAAGHVNDRLYRILQTCKPLKDALPANNRDYTQDGIRFPQMTLYVNGCKETAYQQKGIMFAVADEVHLWDVPGSLGKALSRTTDFDNKGTGKHLVVSQRSRVGDQFDNKIMEGTQETWCVPCQGCKKYFYPVWKETNVDGKVYGMVWDENEKTKPSGSWDFNEVVKTIRYECECGHKHYHSTELQDEWNKHGKYIVQNPNADGKIRSFIGENAIHRHIWENLVKDFLEATKQAEEGIRGEGSPLTDFFQKYMNQPYNPKIVQYENPGLVKTCQYDVTENWTEAVFRPMLIDVQKYHFWVLIREWAKKRKSRMLFFGKVQTEDEVKKIREQFKVENHSVFVDVANTEKETETDRHLVYEFVDRNLWTGLRGEHWSDGKGGFDWVVRGRKIKLYYSQPQMIPGSKNGRWYYNFSPTICRNILKELRDSDDFKCFNDQEYKIQINSEIRIPVDDKYGQRKGWRWIKRKGVPNHAFDLETMSVVTALIHPDVGLLSPL
jgi:hypothetical protein